MTTKENLRSELDALERIEHLVETNDGTYGPAEALRKVGVGDPSFANYRIYESVGGARRRTGCNPKDAPGYARRLNRDAMAADRRRLADIRRQINAGA